MRHMLLGFLVVSILAVSVRAQSLKDRIEAVRTQQLAQNEAESERRAAQRTLAAVRRTLSDVDLSGLTAREAVKWVEDAAGLDIVADWERMELDGIDPEHIVDIKGQHMTAASVLSQIGRQLTVDEPLMWEATPWYVELMTKGQANQRPVVMVYPIHDLLHDVPNFGDQAPTFDLSQISQQSNQGFGGQSGGGGGGGQGGLFGGSGTQNDQRDSPSPADRGNEIARLIQETIEPNIWQANGGSAGSIRFYNGNLIIRAPLYVHQQIGGGATLEDDAPASVGLGTGVDRRYVQMNVRYNAATVNSIRQVPFNALRGNRVSAVPRLRHQRGNGVAGIAGE